MVAARRERPREPVSVTPHRLDSAPVHRRRAQGPLPTARRREASAARHASDDEQGCPRCHTARAGAGAPGQSYPSGERQWRTSQRRDHPQRQRRPAGASTGGAPRTQPRTPSRKTAPSLKHSFPPGMFRFQSHDQAANERACSAPHTLRIGRMDVSLRPLEDRDLDAIYQQTTVGDRHRERGRPALLAGTAESPLYARAASDNVASGPGESRVPARRRQPRLRTRSR